MNNSDDYCHTAFFLSSSFPTAEHLPHSTNNSPTVRRYLRLKQRWLLSNPVTCTWRGVTAILSTAVRLTALRFRAYFPWLRIAAAMLFKIWRRDKKLNLRCCDTLTTRQLELKRNCCCCIDRTEKMATDNYKCHISSDDFSALKLCSHQNVFCR